MAHIHGLHVHGLPDGAAFGVHGGNFLENLRGAALAGLVDVEGVGTAADLLAHGILIDDHAAEPEVGHGILFVVGVHLHGESLEAFAVAFVNGAFLGDVFFQVGHLAADHAGNHVAHAVVVAHFLMLIPLGILSALGGPFSYLVGVLDVVCQEHSAC